MKTLVKMFCLSLLWVSILLSNSDLFFHKITDEEKTIYCNNLNYRSHYTKINDLFQQTTNENKSFFLIIHPSSRNFYPKETNINYNDLDAQLISLLNNKIKILYLKEYLYNYEKNNMNLAVFHKEDGHYNLNGYKQVSNYISKFLNTNLINKEN